MKITDVMMANELGTPALHCKRGTTIIFNTFVCIYSSPINVRGQIAATIFISWHIVSNMLFNQNIDESITYQTCLRANSTKISKESWLHRSHLEDTYQHVHWFTSVTNDHTYLRLNLNLRFSSSQKNAKGQIAAAILHVDKNAFYLPLSIEWVLYRPSWFLSKPGEVVPGTS